MNRENPRSPPNPRSDFFGSAEEQQRFSKKCPDFRALPEIQVYASSPVEIFFDEGEHFWLPIPP
jgi:hypothetical protein